MEIFNTADEIVDAIYVHEDSVERKAAIRVAVKFAMRDADDISKDMDTSSLANKVLLSLLMLSIQGMKPKGGE